MNTITPFRSIPAELRYGLAVVGSLLPRSSRLEWQREWLAELSHEFPQARANTSPAKHRWQMLVRASGAVADVWTLVQIHGVRQRYAELVHSRATPIVLSVLVLMTLAWVTGGFQQSRQLLTQRESDELVLLVQPIPFMGGSGRIPVAQADAWRRASSTVKTLGIWNVERRVIGGQQVGTLKATSAAVALLADSLMQPQRHKIEVDENYAPLFAGIIARLRSGATVGQAQAELLKTAKLQKGWEAPRVVSLTSIRRAPVLPVGVLLVGVLVFSILSIRTRSLIACVWAIATPSLCLAAIAVAWLELVARAPVTELGQVPVEWYAILYVLPVTAGSILAWSFRRTAARRCRTCFRPLMGAVSVGMEGRCLFEPGGSEYLCSDGHGALVVGLAAQNKSDEVWTSWSGSWA